MRLLLAFLWVLQWGGVRASELPVVDKKVFQKGQQWVWAYSEFDKDSNQWLKPYLYEKYTVTEVNGDIVEIEMSSDAELSGSSSAHHKLKANLSECLKAGTNVQKMKAWKIAFYTKSFGPQWELVSLSHQGIPFTEKFNCLSVDKEVVTEFVEWDSELWEIFNANSSGKGSWYFYGHPDLVGVTHSKDFNGYRMELVPSL